MNFPRFNPNGGFLQETYELVKSLFLHSTPESFWQHLDRDEKSTVFLAVLSIYAEENGVVDADGAAEFSNNPRMLPVVFSNMADLLIDDVSEGLLDFIQGGEFFESPVTQEFLSEEIDSYILSWGKDSLSFFRKALLETKFHHEDSESYRRISNILFQLGENPEYFKDVENIYYDIMSDWRWNHPLVNADAMEALSLMKSEKALPLISECLAEKLFDEKIIRQNHLKKNYGLLFSIGGIGSSAQQASNEAPAYVGDEHYGKLLYQIAYLDIDQARLMAMAEILSPEKPKPSSLISRVLEHEALLEDDEPYAFCNEAEGMRFFNQTLAFWNDCLRYRKELLPLVKPDDLSTPAFFSTAGLFFYPLLDLLSENPRLFSRQQREFLRSFRNLKEEVDDWIAELLERPASARDLSDYTKVEFEQRLLSLWNQGYLSFI